MTKKTVDNVVDDLVGTAPGKAAGKAAAPAGKAAAAPANKKPAAPANKGTGNKAPATKGAAALKAAKPAATPAAKGNKAPATKAKPASTGERGARGTGKFYFAPEAKDALVKKLRQIKKPVTTAEYAATHGVPTWQVRLAAKVLVGEKVMNWKKEGATLTLSPK